MKAEFRVVKVNDIICKNNNARQSFDKDKLGLLAGSMANHTQLAPIILNEVDGVLELVAGERRLRAAKLAGNETIEAKVFDGVDKKIALQIMMAENRDRESLNVIEKARGYQMLLGEGMSLDEIAGSEHITMPTIQNRLDLLELPVSIQQMVTREHNPLPMYQALMIKKKVPTEKQQEIAVKAAPEHGRVASEEEIKELVDETQGPKLPMESDLDQDGSKEEDSPKAKSRNSTAVKKTAKKVSGMKPVKANVGMVGKLDYHSVDIGVYLVDATVTFNVDGEVHLCKVAELPMSMAENDVIKLRRIIDKKQPKARIVKKGTSKKTIKKTVAKK